MEHTRKRSPLRALASLLLALALVVGLSPAAGVAWADDSSRDNTISSWDDLENAFSEGGSYTLSANITQTLGSTSNANGVLKADSKDVSIDLSNYSISVTKSTTTQRLFGTDNGGSITLSNGTVTTSLSDSSASADICTVIMRGASDTFTASGVSFSIAEQYVVCTAATTCTVSITGGKVSASSSSSTDSSSDSDSSSSSLLGLAKDNSGGATITLDGVDYGTLSTPISGSGSAYEVIVYVTSNSTAPISTDDQYVRVNAPYTYVLEANGTLYSSSESTTVTQIAINSGGTLRVAGGTVSLAVDVRSGGTLEVQSGTVSGAITSAGAVEISGGTVSGTASGDNGIIAITAGSFSMSGGTVTATSGRAVTLASSGSITGEISGGTISAASSGYALVARTGNSLTVTGGVFTGNSTAVISDTCSAITGIYGVFDADGSQVSANSSNVYKSSGTTSSDSSTTSYTLHVAGLSFVGGGLRTSSTYTTAAMRFGYTYALPADATLSFVTWNYGLDSSVSSNYKPDTLAKVEQDDGSYLTNLVLTGIPSANYDTDVYAKMTLTYTVGSGDDATTYTATTAVADRNVCEIATAVCSDSSATDSAKTFVTSLLQQCSTHASTVSSSS